MYIESYLFLLIADVQIFPRFTVDVCLVLLFMAQHSLMATKFFKSKMTGLGLEAITRSVYAFTTAGALSVSWYKKKSNLYTE